MMNMPHQPKNLSTTTTEASSRIDGRSFERWRLEAAGGVDSARCPRPAT